MNLKSFYEFLEHIRQRPALYLGETSITVFNGYFYGFLEGSKLLENKEIATELRKLHDWVAMRLGCFECTSGWKNMLLKSENGNEEKALKKFFIFLEEFKKRKAKVIYEAKISSQTTKANTAQIIRYTKNKGCFIRWIGKNNEIYPDEFYCYDLKTAFFFSEHFGIKLKKSDWKKVSKIIIETDSEEDLQSEINQWEAASDEDLQKIDS